MPWLAVALDHSNRGRYLSRVGGNDPAKECLAQLNRPNPAGLPADERPHDRRRRSPLRPFTPYEQTVRRLGGRLIAAQRPVRVLDAVQWDAGIEDAFLSRRAASCRW